MMVLKSYKFVSRSGSLLGVYRATSRIAAKEAFAVKRGYNSFKRYQQNTGHRSVHYVGKTKIVLDD